MTYTDYTHKLVAAILSGDTCADCGAPSFEQHFDECPEHPENQGAAS